MVLNAQQRGGASAAEWSLTAQRRGGVVLNA
jgi:hypothetical protein